MSVEKFKKSKLSVGIVGAGPAGSLLAYLLGRKGYQVQLLERKAQVNRKVCGEYLCPKGVELLENLNLLQNLCQGFEPLHGMVMVSPEGEAINAHFPRPKGFERGLSLNRQVFDQRILDLAQTQNIHYYNDKVVTAVHKKSDGKWIIESEDQTKMEVDFLVAGDGRQSKIGHYLGHIEDINTKRVALHCFLPRKTHRGERLGEMHILNYSSYCGLDPVTDDEVNFSIVCDVEKLRKQKPVEIINEAIKGSQRLSAMFDCIYKEDESNTEIKKVTCLKNNNSFIAGNGMAYIGDAAGFIDPLTGEGIYNALLSSVLLSQSLEEADDLESALRNYKWKKLKLGFQKKILNNFFQFLIRKPFLISLTVKFLKKSQKRADQFIGIIGNIHDPITGLIKMLKA